MKYFFVELTYAVPFETLSPVVAEHRAFLQTGFDRGMLLISGPQVPRIGGFSVAKAPSLETLQEFFAEDPYQKKHLAEYRFVEFDPVKRQPFLENWIE